VVEAFGIGVLSLVLELGDVDYTPTASVAAPVAGTQRAQPLGGLVVSLDFELAWGVHDSAGSDGPYRQNLLGARDVLPRIVDLFVEFDVHATWATVGFLFADSREELERYTPESKPNYRNPKYDPYQTKLGRGEKDDPLHFAPSLIQLIGSAPGQEIASHTFSHYYCLAEGQSIAEFEADLAAAQAIGRAHSHALKSLVLPRRQNRADYLPAIAAAGFTAYRPNEANGLNRPPANDPSLLVRGVRLLDSYVPLYGASQVPWAATLPDAHGLVGVRESRFLRPMSSRFARLEGLRFKRLANAMRLAARTGNLFHLWWHPHNFGARPNENLSRLRQLLELLEELRLEYGFDSYSIAEVNCLARQSASRNAPAADDGGSGPEPSQHLRAADNDKHKATL